MYQKIIDDFSKEIDKYRTKKKELENEYYENQCVMCEAENPFSETLYSEYIRAKNESDKDLHMIGTIENILKGIDVARDILLNDSDFMDGLIKENGGYKPCSQK